MTFKFNDYLTKVIITDEIQKIDIQNAIVVCDENTQWIAQTAAGTLPRCVLKSGEENKNWQAIEKILQCANNAGLDRNGTIIGVGGGVICDMAAFAASIYMRGCNLVLVATTLLAMADAAIGGKTGFDLFGIKNLAGTFYPAKEVYMPMQALSTLPEKEWKSGMGEVIKTGVLAGDSFFDEVEEFLIISKGQGTRDKGQDSCTNVYLDTLSKDCEQRPLSPVPCPLSLIQKSVQYKCNIVSNDFKESGQRRLLNLGHTFGHAIEAAEGLGKLTHGEAVAIGIVKACELGVKLNITPKTRAEKIKKIISDYGYDAAYKVTNKEVYYNAIKSDKKKKNSALTFIVPDEQSATTVEIDDTLFNQLVNDGFI